MRVTADDRSVTESFEFVDRRLYDSLYEVSHLVQALSGYGYNADQLRMELVQPLYHMLNRLHEIQDDIAKME